MFRFLRELLQPRAPVPARTPYVANLTATADGRVEQAFVATVVSVETTFGNAIALSDLVHQETVHGVYISAPATGGPGEVELEYNDQGNSCTGAQFRVQLLGRVVRILFAKEANMFSGRIEFDPVDDSLPGEGPDYELPLAALAITLEVDDEELSRVTTALQGLSSCGVAVEVLCT